MIRQSEKVVTFLLSVLLLLAVVLSSCGDDGTKKKGTLSEGTTSEGVASGVIETPTADQPSEQPTEAPTVDIPKEPSIGLKYEQNSDGTAYTVVGMGLCKDVNVLIPEEYEGLPVTAVGDSAFKYCTNLVSLVVPDCVTVIGKKAFLGCENLSYVAIGDGVQIIGEDAFHECFNLTDLTLGQSVKEIGHWAFRGCNRLPALTLPDSLTAIGDYAFAECTSLENVVFSQTAEAGVKLIGNCAFYECTSLMSAVLPDSVTEIGEWAFYNCINLTSVTLGEGVETVGDSAFYECRKLIEVINRSALPITVGSSDCGFVAHYAKNVHDGASKIENVDGYLFYTHEEQNYLLGYTGKDAILVLPESYQDGEYEIDQYAFYECDGLTSVTIGQGVTGIGNGAFYGCYKLIEVINRSSLSIVAGTWDHGYVAEYAKEVHAEEETKIENRDDYLFYRYGGTNYLIGYVGAETSLRLPVLEDEEETYKIHQYAFYRCDSLINVTVGQSVTGIGRSAFEGCPNLTRTTVGENVQNIGYRAFYECTGLTDIFFDEKEVSEDEERGGSSVTSIGGESFRHCKRLVFAELPESVTDIGDLAFYKCDNLVGITIGTKVKNIGRSAFAECYGLLGIQYRGTQEQWNAVGKGDDWNRGIDFCPIICEQES